MALAAANRFSQQRVSAAAVVFNFMFEFINRAAA
jgi:hypothetical protein